MIGILVAACLDVTLYNVVLIYLSLFYIAQKKDSTSMFMVMLFWSSFFMLVEYLTSQFDVVNKNLEMKEMSDWLDLSMYNAFTFGDLEHFAFDKVLVLLLLWMRLQMHRYIKEVKPSHYDAAVAIMSEKSKVMDFIIDSTAIFVKIVFVCTLIGMMLVLMVQTVNVVNWIFLILLYVFLCVNFAVKQGESEKTKLKILQMFALIISYFCATMIILQTLFLLFMQMDKEQKWGLMAQFREE